MADLNKKVNLFVNQKDERLFFYKIITLQNYVMISGHSTCKEFCEINVKKIKIGRNSICAFYS